MSPYLKPLSIFAVHIAHQYLMGTDWFHEVQSKGLFRTQPNI